MVFEEIYKKSRGQGIRVSSLPEAKHLDIFWFLLVLEHTFSFVPCANGALLSCSTRTRLPPSELKGRLLVMMGDVDLHVAVMVGDRRDVKKYINAGGDLEVRDDDGATALFHAAFWTHVDVARDLVQAGADVNAQRNDGATPIHVAVKNNQPHMTHFLVNAMANLCVQEEFGDTPLHWAYRSKATECIDILLAAEADPEVCNHMGKTPRECEGTGVDRQDEEVNDEGDSENQGGHHAPEMEMSDAPSAGDASTLLGDPESQEEYSRKSPTRPSDGRSTVAITSPRTILHGRSMGNEAACEPVEPRVAHFRVSYPPNIKSDGKWHSITAYMLEPSAYRVVKQAHQGRLSGKRQPLNSGDVSADSDWTLPPGTEIVVRPRFPPTCSINPVNATVAWVNKANAVSFEMRSPTLTCSGTVTGCVDFYIGAVLIGQAHVKMNVVRSSASAEEPDVLGPAAKMFEAVYACFAPADAPLLLPSLERIRRLGITKLSWWGVNGSEQDARTCIREASNFQICWSTAAQQDARVKRELKYAASLAKNGALSVRAIYWDPSMNPSTIETDQGIVFPVRLHNSFLLEEPCIILERMQDEIAHGSVATTKPPRQARNNVDPLDGEYGARDGAKREWIAQEEIPVVEKLCTPTVINTRCHISMLRKLVSDADVVDLPCLVWISPDDSGNPNDVDDLEDASWLSKPIRISFLCPVSMKAGRCGEDGRGYRMTLPRGWAAKIGIALRIGAVIVAAATDAGRMDDLPIPSPPTSDPGGGGTGESSPASGEWRGKVVDAVYDELASAVDAKTNDMIDSAFMEVNTDDEVSSPPPLAQLCKDTKHSYANLRSLLHKHDKGFKKTGLVRVNHESTNKPEWVHPSVANLFRLHGPKIFQKKVLEAVDAESAAAAARHAQNRATGFDYPTLDRRDSSREEGRRLDGTEVMDTLRMLEGQIIAMVKQGRAEGA